MAEMEIRPTDDDKYVGFYYMVQYSGCLVLNIKSIAFNLIAYLERCSHLIR